MNALSLGMPFGKSMGLPLEDDDQESDVTQPKDLDSETISSVSILGASSLATNSLLDYLQRATSSAAAQQTGCTYKGLLLLGSPTCFLAKNLEPNAVVVGMLIVDINGYDKLSPNISLYDSGRTMFHDDMDYFRGLAACDGKWRHKPFSILMINCTEVAQRVSLKQISRLYPDKANDFAMNMIEGTTIEDRVRGVAGFFTNALLQVTDRQISTYVSWAEKDNGPESVVHWVQAMVKDILAEPSSAHD